MTVYHQLISNDEYQTGNHIRNPDDQACEIKINSKMLENMQVRAMRRR